MGNTGVVEVVVVAASAVVGEERSVADVVAAMDRSDSIASRRDGCTLALLLLLVLSRWYCCF